jgi:hypothetical protein
VKPRFRRGILALAPTAAALLLPKCPFCWIGLAASLGAIGVTPALYGMATGSLIVLGLGAVIGLAVRRRRSHGAASVALAVLGGALVLVGRFVADALLVSITGGLMLAATLWLPQRRGQRDCGCLRDESKGAVS